ncbi:hypothetical protein Ancab_039251 [Ancistrocladus abbreviatus]
MGEWDGRPGDLNYTCWRNRGSNAMEIKALDSDIKWLEECFAGEMHFEDDVPRFIKMINEERRFKCLARPIGYRSVLISPSFTLKVGEALKVGQGWLHRWCSFIRPWKRTEVNDDLFLIKITEEIESPLSFFGYNINKDKLHLSDDSSRTTDCHGTNSFILDSVDRARKRCQILSGPSLSYISDRGTTKEQFQNRDGLGPYGPSGISEFPPLKGDGSNSFVGLNMGLGVSSSAQPKNSTNVDQNGSPALCPNPGPSNSNSEPQNSLPSDTSKSEFRSNELF